MCNDFSRSAFAVDTMQGLYKCIHSNSFPCCCCRPRGQGLNIFGDVTVLFKVSIYFPVLLLTSFWRSFLFTYIGIVIWTTKIYFLHHALLSRHKAKGLHEILLPVRTCFFDYFTVRIRLIPEWKYGESKQDDLQKRPYSKRALVEKSEIFIAIIFKFC